MLLPPGDTGEVELRLDLTKPAPESRLNEWAFDTQAVPVVSLPARDGRQVSQPAGRWKLSGRVRRLFDVSVPVVYWNDDLLLGEAFPEQIVEVTCLHRVESLAAVVNPPLAEVRVEPLDSAEETAKYRLRVAPVGSLAPGDFACAVELRAALPNGEAAPPLVLPVRGRVVREVQAFPIALTLPAIPVGGTWEENIALQSRAGVPFDVQFARSNDENVLLVRGETPEVGRISYRVRVCAASAGSREAELVFGVRLENRDAYELRVRVWWCATATPAVTNSALK